FPPVGHSAAFFDLDKTVIAKSSALAFGRPFFRDGLITRRDVFKAAYAQLVYKIGGADEVQMARIRDYVAKLCKGWKVEHVREIAERRGYDLAESYAYSDSVSDVPLLAAVGHPTAVNADRGLRRTAVERGWPLLEFRHPIPLGRRLRDRPAVPVAAAAVAFGAIVAIGLFWYGRHRKSRTVT